jgi:hypothetical protein
VRLHNAPPDWASCLRVSDRLPCASRLARLYPPVRCTGAHPRSSRLAPICYSYLPSRRTRSPPVPLSMSGVRSALPPHMLSSPVSPSQTSYVPAFPCPCTAWLPALHPASVCRPCMLMPTSLGLPGLALARLHMTFAGHLTHKLTFPLYLAASIKPVFLVSHTQPTRTESCATSSARLPRTHTRSIPSLSAHAHLPACECRMSGLLPPLANNASCSCSHVLVHCVSARTTCAQCSHRSTVRDCILMPMCRSHPALGHVARAACALAHLKLVLAPAWITHTRSSSRPCLLAFHTCAPCRHLTHEHVQSYMLTKPKPMHAHMYN